MQISRNSTKSFSQMTRKIGLICSRNSATRLGEKPHDRRRERVAITRVIVLEQGRRFRVSQTVASGGALIGFRDLRDRATGRARGSSMRWTHAAPYSYPEI